jgi:filamentous hemagglutinin family protein
MTSRIPAHLLRPALLSPLVLLLSLDAAAAAAGPAAGTLSLGSATVSPAGNVTLQTNSAVPINWQGSAITGNVAGFVQPSASGATLNRVAGGNINVTGGTATVTGTLQSNPTVTLINPSGIVIQGASQLPTGGTVSSGSASFNVQGNVLTVTNSSGAVINWQDFSIGSGATTNFVQPSTSSVVLNRVVGQNASNIGGTLSSNGRVFLTNPNGALFTSGAQVNTAGFTVTTSTISNAEFLAGSNGSTGPGSTLSVDGPLSLQGGNLSVTNTSIQLTGLLTAPGTLTLNTPPIQTGGTPVLLNPPLPIAVFRGTPIGRIGGGTGGTQSTDGIASGGAVVLDTGPVSLSSLQTGGGTVALSSAGLAPAGGQATGGPGTITLASTGGTGAKSSVSGAAAAPRGAAASFTLQKREPMF